MRYWMLALLYLGTVSVAQAEIYECVDSLGNKRFTNIKAEAQGCTLMKLPKLPSVPPPAAAAPKGASQSPTPRDFPKVDDSTQNRRDAERRKILERELASEQTMLDRAKQELAEQENLRLGSERNYQRVLDRLEPYKKNVELHESNIENLRKELSALR